MQSAHSDSKEPRADHCPTCGRPFTSVKDYPRVRVLSFERLPIPEAVDQMSWAAAEKRLARRRKKQDEAESARDGGINMTPAIAAACQKPEIQAYFNQLAALVNQEVAPTHLLPPLKAHGMFRWAYPVEGTDLYLALKEAAPLTSGERITEIQIYSDGPNMGSAGGPTLQQLGPVAQIHYRGLLESGPSP
jgi:endogenous inhibitor of DNA gyrase (YacG/DUF329 family)